MNNPQKLEILKTLNHPNHNRIYQHGTQAERDALLAAVRSGDTEKVREVLNGAEEIPDRCGHCDQMQSNDTCKITGERIASYEATIQRPDDCPKVKK